MILWIDRTLALAIHDRQVAEHGGSAGLRDDNLLESALARPQQLHSYGDPQPDLADLAATLAYGIAKNHPFVDGNKRTAHVVCRTFLALNDADLEAPAEEKFMMILALAEGRVTVAEYASWLRPRLRLQAPPSIQEPRSTYRKPARKRTAKAG